MEKKISVIIPMYNVEPYIAHCLDSLLKQTYTNLEIVLVNDGSSDLTGEIAEQYRKRDQRINIIHIENGGASNARNIGLRHATGEYVLFIDADDYIKNDMIELLFTYSQEYNADVAIARLEGTHQQVFSFQEEENRTIEIWDNEQTLKEMLRTEKVSMFPVAKLIRKEILADLEFDVSLKLAEDAMFLTQLYLKEDINTIFVNQVLYAYFQREGSATKSVDLSYVFDTIKAYEYIYQQVISHYPALNKELVNRKNWADLEVYDKLVAFGDINEQKCISLERKIKSSYWQILKDPLFTNNRKIALTILLFNRKLYQKIVKRKKGAE
ncbi:Glycosyl transferase family 2 [Granulicatella balaenopterae]|uniref:Glycosyl transferase family 2 n=1 Tax=Granulicatella balaenopterae TaxID=137733 RepID=A0A1H9NE78_9LACT|nr:glycosyltransferase family 2 protein [Granulicatella balaenopterae]SER34232.1 Glycosyl transferase family 2 [Granulicatella balaenopterae]